MLNFTGSLSLSGDALVIFISEKYEFIGKNNLLSKDIMPKVHSFIKSLKNKKQDDTINSMDITESKKCFVVKISNNNDNSYFEEIGGILFTKISSFKDIKSIDIFADTLIKKNNQFDSKRY